MSRSLADVQAEQLAPPALVHAVGDHQRLLAHAARLTHSLDLGVQPQVAVAALQRALPEGPQLLVERGAEPRDVALAHARDAELLDDARPCGCSRR